MSAWTMHQLTFTRTTASTAAAWQASPGTPITIGPLNCAVGRRVTRAISELAASPGEVVPEAFSMVVYINQSDNPGVPLFSTLGIAVVMLNDMATQKDIAASELNGRTGIVEVVRVYDNP